MLVLLFWTEDLTFFSFNSRFLYYRLLSVQHWESLQPLERHQYFSELFTTSLGRSWRTEFQKYLLIPINYKQNFHQQLRCRSVSCTCIKPGKINPTSGDIWWKGNSRISYTGMVIRGADDTSRAMSWWESPTSWRIRRIPHKSHEGGRKQQQWKLKEKKESPRWIKRKWSADLSFGLGKAIGDFWMSNFSARGRHWNTDVEVELAEGRCIPWR